ncbi:hypothetical protein SAMN02745127_01393 [Oceanospirillum multiglobuliferum]|uniref:Proteophosphoglycan n=1 Tax=Oceanospirillum multiglobuliferum TaxID=64969 RepID=A0A1T4PAD5_9GAMM|nr:DUF1285 domain-containing protein [Oceanospirillum multiglobuliferum]OPX55634.1 proteophosphoglycan precursor [Oceanospirillum multiglobuliferum]SJZ88494.1 hypothetical protein SAMN02745127_01393 [Oceanospirillum multiglobuliferum]
MSLSFSPLNLAKQIEANQGEKGLPPIHLWNPDFCGAIDMRIARDGQWYYMGTPIGRAPLVRMFSTILRKDPEHGYVLVTPVEKVGIQVEDAPFLITQQLTEHNYSDDTLVFLTNVGDIVPLDTAHPLHVTLNDQDEPIPYLLVRDALEGRLHRNLFYQLIEQAVEQTIGDETHLGVLSAGQFWSLGKL